MKPSEVLMLAAELIADPEDWCKDHAELHIDGHTRRCITGAIRSAAWRGTAFNVSELVPLIFETLRWARCGITGGYGTEEYVIQRWNDEPAREHPEVVDLLHRASRLAKESER